MLDLREKLVPGDTAVERHPWRCCGCQQLMYGVEWIGGRQYPTPENTPAGMFHSKQFPRVCHVCWEMLHALANSPTGYWEGIDASATKKRSQLGSGGNYLAT